MRGTVDADFDVLKAQGCAAALIAGAYRRSLEMVPNKLIADSSTRAVTLQTPTLFCDLRIAEDRPVLPEGVTSFEELPIATLAALVRTTHCFAGYSYIDGDNPISDDQHPETMIARNCDRALRPLSSSSMCTRIHALDWQPMPRLSENRWRIQPEFEHGGWVEWSSRLDAHHQSEYVEHWRTLANSRDGPFVALRRRASTEQPAAFFLVCGEHFVYIADRPLALQLPVVTPGTGGHPADRGRVEPLVEAAEASGDRAGLLATLSMECHYGRVRRSESPDCAETSLLGMPAHLEPERPNWQILLSTRPWREGTFFDTASLCQGYDGTFEVFDEHRLVAPGLPPPPSVLGAVLALGRTHAIPQPRAG